MAGYYLCIILGRNFPFSMKMRRDFSKKLLEEGKYVEKWIKDCGIYFYVNFEREKRWL